MEIGLVVQIEGQLVKVHMMGDELETDLYFTYTVGGMGDILFSFNGEYYAMVDRRKQGELIAYDSGQLENKQVVCWMLLRSVSSIEPLPQAPRIVRFESVLYDVIERMSPGFDPGLRGVRLKIKNQEVADYLVALAKCK